MKKLLVGLFAIISFTAFADLVEIARIHELKGKHRDLIYYKDGLEVVLVLKEKVIENEEETEVEKKIVTFYDDFDLTKKVHAPRYHYNLSKNLFKASRAAYGWCWIRNQHGRYDTIYHAGYTESSDNWTRPGTFLYILTPITAPICGVLPGLPAVTALVLAPIDSLITLLAKRKNQAKAIQLLLELIAGKNNEASARDFKSTLNLIRRLKKTQDRLNTSRAFG